MSDSTANGTMYIHELFDLSGKHALVTGSTRGIGYTLARGLARAGCSIIVNGRVPEHVDEATRQLRQEGFTVHSTVFDVREEALIRVNIERIEKSVGAIDILVNNAGIQIRGPLEEFKLADWQEIIDVNLTGVFLVSKAVAQHMLARKQGKIINVCSVQSELARPTIAPYTASKGGVRNLTRAMATEWGKFNIQVNGIAPGYFKTDLTRALVEDEKFDAWLRARTPANRWGEPEELVGTLIFLSSKASDYVNGHLLFVDGGMVACV